MMTQAVVDGRHRNVARGKADVVLDAGRELMKAKGRFTISELAVKAWEISPELFGLAGFEGEHPNSKTVESLLYGRKGLILRDYIEAVGNAGAYVVNDRVLEGRTYSQQKMQERALSRYRVASTEEIE